MNMQVPHGDGAELLLPCGVPDLRSDLAGVRQPDGFGGELNSDGGVDGEGFAALVEGVDEVGLADAGVADDNDCIEGWITLVEGLLVVEVNVHFEYNKIGRWRMGEVRVSGMCKRIINIYE